MNNQENSKILERELLFFFLGKGFESINATPKPDVTEASFLLWMEEVKMWLRNRYQIFAWVKPSYTVNENTFHPKIDFLGNGSLMIMTKYDSYEDALMHTLRQFFQESPFTWGFSRGMN